MREHIYWEFVLVLVSKKRNLFWFPFVLFLFVPFLYVTKKNIYWEFVLIIIIIKKEFEQQKLFYIFFTLTILFYKIIIFFVFLIFVW